MAHAGTQPPETFRHEALFYSGDAAYVDGTTSFIDEGIELGDVVLAMVPPRQLDLIQTATRGDPPDVLFADMTDVGRNPARIIPAWQRFIDDQRRAGRTVRGIGEPIWAGRSPAELVECQIHEDLLNRAFATADPWALMCPYDVDALDRDVVEEAERSHLILVEHGRHRLSHPHDQAGPQDTVRYLGEPPPGAHWISFDGPSMLPALRQYVATWASSVGYDDDVSNLVLAVHEIASNSLDHGGGRGVLRLWDDDDWLVCEVRDSGAITDPLAGRIRPDPLGLSGRGLWLVNQTMDLVQIRTFDDGGCVRIRLCRNRVGAACAGHTPA